MRFLVLLGLALIPAADPGEAGKALEGTWSVKSFLNEGAKPKDPRDRKAEWVFKGEKYLLRHDGKDEAEGRQTFDSNPRKA